MKGKMLTLVVLVATLAALGAPSTAEAQEQYTFTAALLAGVGGSTDADTGDGLDNSSFQLNFALLTEPRTHVGLRLGQIDLDLDETFNGLFDAELTYVNIGGEYRYQHGFYQSGIYAGLGAYQLEGTPFIGDRDTDTSIGAVLGLTGEFQINKRFSALIELAGHYTDLENVNLFFTGHAGLAVHF